MEGGDNFTLSLLIEAISQPEASDGAGTGPKGTSAGQTTSLVRLDP